MNVFSYRKDWLPFPELSPIDIHEITTFQNTPHSNVLKGDTLFMTKTPFWKQPWQNLLVGMANIFDIFIIFSCFWLFERTVTCNVNTILLQSIHEMAQDEQQWHLYWVTCRISRLRIGVLSTIGAVVSKAVQRMPPDFSWRPEHFFGKWRACQLRSPAAARRFDRVVCCAPAKRTNNTQDQFQS